MIRPPLPEPGLKTHGPFDDRNKLWFTEAQLLAYRAEVIEMCAAQCEERYAKFSKRETATDDLRGFKNGAQFATADCAEELRSLK